MATAAHEAGNGACSAHQLETGLLREIAATNVPGSTSPPETALPPKTEDRDMPGTIRDALSGSLLHGSPSGTEQGETGDGTRAQSAPIARPGTQALSIGSPSSCGSKTLQVKKSATSDLVRYLRAHSMNLKMSPYYKERLKRAFQEIDQDGSGFISRDELDQAMNVCLALPHHEIKEVLDEAIKRADKDKDGVLDYEEFFEMTIQEQPHICQRIFQKWSIVIELTMVALYLLCAPLFYCYLDDDHEWNFWDGLYFGAVTLTTVGYGDFHPVNDGMRLFTICYILIGLILVWQILETAAARFVRYYERRVAEINRFASAKIGESLASMTIGVTTPTGSQTSYLPSTVTKISSFTSKLSESLSANPNACKRVSTMLALLLLVVVPVAVGTIFISINEGWPWFHGFYWSVVTCTTVGYGDLILQNQSSRIFATFFVLSGFACAGIVIGEFASMRFELAIESRNRRLLARSLSMNMIFEMSSGGQVVDKCAFVCAMLVQMEKVTEDDLVPLLEKFEELDADGDGQLTAKDLQKKRSARRRYFFSKRRPSKEGISFNTSADEGERSAHMEVPSDVNGASAKVEPFPQPTEHAKSVW